MKTSKSHKKTYTPEERETYRAEQRQKGADLMKAGIEELLTSEGWQRWAAMRARLHNYSFNNTMLLLAQMPDASFVASGKFWIEHDRKIISGQGSALRVFAPLFRKPTSEEIAAGRNPTDKILYAFKLVPVFDISQTDGEPLPINTVEPLTGDSHAEYLRPLEVFAHTLGYSVSFEDLSDGLMGYCNTTAKHIAVNSNEALNQNVKTLVHEIAHAMGVGYQEYGREQAEVLVETAAFIVATSIGLDTSGYSIPYVATWGDTNAVAAIERFASTVDEIARKIERAVKDAEVAA